MRATGKKIIIGDGHPPVWRELQSFLENRLHLETGEFNSVSTAGVSTKERLEEMLDDAAFAFVLMTPEDDQPDGKVRARQNVVHEIGLFQGRLGFRKAIALQKSPVKNSLILWASGKYASPAASYRRHSRKFAASWRERGLLRLLERGSCEPRPECAAFEARSTFLHEVEIKPAAAAPQGFLGKGAGEPVKIGKIAGDQRPCRPAV